MLFDDLPSRTTLASLRRCLTLSRTFRRSNAAREKPLRHMDVPADVLGMDFHFLDALCAAQEDDGFKSSMTEHHRKIVDGSWVFNRERLGKEQLRLQTCKTCVCV